MSDDTHTTLARLRRSEGLSLEAVAELTGVDVSAVAGWENGTPIPARERAVLAARFGVDEKSLTKPLSLPTSVTRRPGIRPRRFARRRKAGPRLANLRRAEGLSVSDLAHVIGVSAREIAGWESDGGIPEEHVGALTRRFGVSEDWLLGREALPTDVKGDTPT